MATPPKSRDLLSLRLLAYCGTIYFVEMAMWKFSCRFVYEGREEKREGRKEGGRKRGREGWGKGGREGWGEGREANLFWPASTNLTELVARSVVKAK